MWAHAAAVLYGRPMRSVPLGPAASVAALAVLFLGIGSALAQSVGDTVDLKSTFVQRIDGAHTGDDAGDRVARAGDVNGDGREDVILGAYTADAGGRVNAGAAYLVTSPARTVKLGSGAAGVVEIRGGRTEDSIGQMVAGIGDVNGDGRPDQAVGSYDLKARGRNKAGSMWVILSTAGRSVIDVRRPVAGVVRIDGSSEDAELDPAAAAGDFNGDGIGDIVVGETDAAYVILGSKSFGAVDLGNPGANVIPITATDKESLGTTVAGVGDVNGDGLADVAVGYTGGAVVIFGRKTQVGSIDVEAAGAGTYDIGGASKAPPASLGDALAGVGDLNGDGRADIAVSASNAAALGKKRAGVVAIYYGKAGPEPQAYPPPASQGLRILGTGNDDRAGYTVAGGRDLNGDGRPDIVVGAFLAGGLGRTDAGVTYRVSPNPAGGDVWLGNLGSTVKRWVGSHAQEQSGYAVDTADTDGDGTPEILVGAGFAAHRGRHSGSVYVVDSR
jgi:hypothetical protein